MNEWGYDELLKDREQLLAENDQLRDLLIRLTLMVEAVLTDSQLDHPVCGVTIRKAIEPIDAYVRERVEKRNGTRTEPDQHNQKD